MESLALLLAATLNAGTVLAIAGARPADQRDAPASSTSAPKGMMLVRRDRRLRDRRSHRQRLARLRRRRGAPARCWPRLFGVLVIWLNTNQYATGLALSLFGAGFSAFVGIDYAQEKLGRARAASSIPGWPTFRSSGRRSSASTRWSTSRSR